MNLDLKNIKKSDNLKKQVTVFSLKYMTAIILAIAMYTYVPFSFNGLNIPYLIGFVISVGVLTLRYKELDNRIIVYSFLILLVMIFSIILNMKSIFLRDMLFSIALYVYSIICGLAIYITIKSWSRDLFSKTMMVFCLIILVGSIVEIITPFKNITLAFTSLFPNPILNIDILRDIQIAGFYRPRFFTSETSHAVAGLLVFLCSWFITTKSQYRIIIYLFLLTLGFIIFRSPTIFLGIPLMFLSLLLLLTTNKSEKRKYTKALSILFFVISSFVILGVGLFALDAVMAERSQVKIDQSYLVRIVAAADIIGKVIAERPLFGFGIGAHGDAKELIIQSFVDSGIREESVFNNFDTKINSLLASSILYLGLVGSLIYFVIMVLLANRASGVNGLILTGMIFVFGSVNGAMYSPKFYLYFFFLAAAIKIVSMKGKLHDNIN